MTESALSKEQVQIDSGKSPWPVYERDASTYANVFDKEFPEEKSIAERLRERHVHGERVVVVDLCGATDARSIGADHTIALTLKIWPSLQEEMTPERTVVEGDIFKSGVVEKVVGAIEKEGGQTQCIFLRPVGGLGGHGFNMYSHLRLYSALQKLYPRVASGGDIYIDLAGFQGAAILRDVLEASGEITCEVHSYRRKDGYPLDRDSIHVRRGENSPAALKTIEELRAMPSIETNLRQMLKE